jgi:hypothetical protein
LPIAYASRILNNDEKHYSVTEKELLSIVWGCKYYHQYLFGRKFTIVTDHKPLTCVFSVMDHISRLLHWRLKLKKFDYQVIHKPGTKNTNADALSRINVAEVRADVKTDSVPTEAEKRKISQEFHEQLIGGHLGMNRTFDRLKQYISWPGMKREIEDYVKQCEICQKNKVTQIKTKLPLQITDIPDVVLEKSSMDILDH